MIINYKSKQFKIIVATLGVGIITAMINQSINVYKLNEPIKTTSNITKVHTTNNDTSDPISLINNDSDNILVTKSNNDKPKHIFALVQTAYQYPDGSYRYTIVNTDTLSYDQKVELQADVDKAKRALDCGCYLDCGC